MRKSSVSTPRRVRCDVANAMVPSSSQGSRRLSRQSMSSVLSRRSSIQDNKKETRPMNDRQNLQKNLKTLATYLTENNYTHLGVPYSLQKVLNSPSIRDVTCIFQFLISLIGIDYPRDKKFEDEFPRIMKELLYPYAISKRQMQPIGSMHNWPSIVNALSWLCNFSNLTKAACDDPFDFPKDTDEDMLIHLDFEFNLQAYNAFLLGEDDHTQIDKDFCDELPKMIGMDEVKEFDEQMTLLSDRMEDLEKLEVMCDHTEKQNILLSADSKKLIAYNCEVEDFVSKIDVRISNLTEERENIKSELGIIKAKVDENAKKIASQRITVQEMQALETIAENLKSQLAENQETLSKMQAEAVTSEAASLKEKDKLSAIIEEYHSIVRECNLIPESACNAQGFNYSIHLPKPESETSPSNIDDIMRRLKLILKKWKESSRELRVEEMKAIEDIQQMKEMHASKLEEAAYMEAKVRRQQEGIDAIKKDFADEISKIRAETSKIEEEIVRLGLRDKGVYDIEDLQKTNADLHKEVIQLEEKARNKEVAVKEFLFKFCEIIINHRNAIEERVLRFEKVICKWCDERQGVKIIFDYANLREELQLDELKAEVDGMLEKCRALK